MEKNKKNTKGKPLLWCVSIIFEVILLFILLINSLQIILYGTNTVLHIFDQENFPDYISNFYDPNFTSEDEEDNFNYVYFITTDYERELIENEAVSSSKVIMFTWAKIITVEVYILSFVLVSVMTRKLLKEKNLQNPFNKDNIEIIKKIKRYLVIGFFVYMLGIIFISIFCNPLGTMGNINVFLIFLIMYGLVDYVNLLIKKGMPLKNKK